MWTAPSLQELCVHMSGLLRSHMNAGQDEFRDMDSKQKVDFKSHCPQRSVPRLGSIDHTICSFLQVHASDQRGSFQLAMVA
ncbi:hypothetical protein N184_28440 [Sinorhizobium sp. GL28]|nr:hypothetical protein N184_28440 [Sinorhizobium sp. GL28]